ncbi:M16 family metallopeptidase [Candidatus Paracaedibacter symbiosus]|uniref:M16 family metallopeptidase n=1 Tax=Candidatus Paracaedibacter symbiosus TaxID=244582 RepID=UPI00068E073C|nr:pitrilysin family protein [Candidatus Paracaedibacter symbiosus]
MLVKTSLIALGISTGMTEAYSMTQKPAQVQENQTLQPSQIKVTDFKTAKGLAVWLVENQDIPVLSVSICFKNAGSKSDPKDKIGLANFLSGIINEGCGPYDSATFKKYLLEHNINLSVDQSSDDFIIAFRAPKTSIQQAFRIIELMLTEPGFASEPMERVKQQLLTILNQSLHSERAIGGDLMNKRAFPNHPYGHSIEENLRDLMTIMPADLKKYMADRFTKDELTLTVAGAINQQELSEILDSTFTNLPEKAVPETIANLEPISPGDVFIKEMDIPQSAILFYQPSIGRHDPDFYAAMVLMRILGDGGFESRLWNEVREKRGLAYGVSATLSWNDHTAYIIGSTATQNASVEKVISIIREQWEKVKKEGVTAAELSFVKERMIGSYPLAFGSTAQIVAMLRMHQLDGMRPNFINERNDIIRKVTLEDVNRVAKKLLNPEKLSFIVVGKPEGLKAGESQ